jgi:DNA-directed RNA polymerase subunit E'/Rpb7
MIGLAVYLNGKKLSVAGAQDLSVLNTIVSAVGQLGKSTARLGGRRSVDLHLSVGGLTNRGGGLEDEHLRWIRLRRLRVGDRISVRIVRTDRPDKHESASSAGGNMQQINQKKRKLAEAQNTRRVV